MCSINANTNLITDLIGAAILDSGGPFPAVLSQLLVS